jgi:hypothetical protein
VVDGNFRVKAAKIAREKRIPSIIKKNLTGNDLEARITALAVHIHILKNCDKQKKSRTTLRFPNIWNPFFILL